MQIRWAFAAVVAGATFALALPDGVSADAKASAGQARTVTVSSIRAGRGERIYAAQCADCHGERAEGRLAVAPSLVSKSFLRAASDDLIMEMTRTRHAGTDFQKEQQELSPRDLEELVAFLRKTTETKPAKLAEGAVKGDAAAGAKTFARTCAMCHGMKGRGYLSHNPAPAIGRKVFLDAVSDGYLRYLIKVGKSETKMRGFAEGKTVAEWAQLTDQEVEDVIAWLRNQKR